eukprot:GHVN01095705.1.p3 GENE.GHVN01095705.1~~GHVN01095705.1.p3  ORF type:complete len:144 (-),score=14.69 GHVN01095705.1:49-480(-)
MNTIYHGAGNNPSGACYMMFQQMAIPNLRKIAEVAIGGNPEHKYRVMKNQVFMIDLRNTKHVSDMTTSIEKGMESCMRFITCNAYGDEKGDIAWKTLGGHLMDIIGAKERAIGAAAAVPPAPAAPNGAGPMPAAPDADAAMHG